MHKGGGNKNIVVVCEVSGRPGLLTFTPTGIKVTSNIGVHEGSAYNIQLNDNKEVIFRFGVQERSIALRVVKMTTVSPIKHASTAATHRALLSKLSAI